MNCLSNAETSCLYLSYFLCKKQLCNPLKTVDPIRPYRAVPGKQDLLNSLYWEKTMIDTDTYVTDLLKHDMTKC